MKVVRVSVEELLKILKKYDSSILYVDVTIPEDENILRINPVKTIDNTPPTDLDTLKDNINQMLG